MRTFRSLREREAYVLLERMMTQKTLLTLANELGVNLQRVHQIEAAARRRYAVTEKTSVEEARFRIQNRASKMWADENTPEGFYYELLYENKPEWT